ncbi:MAG: hypothetical protein WBV53_03605 [Solirubrobacterales bacterium]
MRPIGAVILLVVLALAMPATAVATPAVNEYTLDLPDAKGKAESPGAAPVADPGRLPPHVVSRLRQIKSGKVLAAIATAGSLGAPAGVKGGAPAVAGDQPSALAAFGSAAGDPAAIGLIALLLVIVAGMALARRRMPKP